MMKLKPWQSTTTFILTLHLGLAPVTIPLLNPTPVKAQAAQSFQDVPSDYWAADFIQALVSRGIISGFPNGTFKPDAPVTRAQFAAMVNNAFEQEAIRTGDEFRDVPSNYWATPAIQSAYRMGFLSGYPNNQFRPEQNIPKEQVLTALANGLNYQASGSINSILDYYSDEENIADFAIEPIAAATENNLVVNYPNLRQLNPKDTATRAEVAAMIYQGLVSEGRAGRISSQYVVNQTSVMANYRIPSGVTFPVAYDREKILVTPEETVDLTLTIAANITTNDGQLLIPAGTQVVGELRPMGEGTQFVAQQLVFPDEGRIEIQAVSPVITDRETVEDDTDSQTLIENAALGTAAAAAISAITGNRSATTGAVLSNAGSNTLASLIQRFLGQDEVELIVIDPETDLDLTLEDDLVLAAQEAMPE
jgi:hypothetical protein